MSFLSARKKVGMSQIDVAKALNISDAAVSMWETGKTMPRASLLLEIANLYQCTIDDLIRSDGSHSST